MSELFKYLLVWIGIFHVFFAVLGFLDVLHYRLYIGVEDKVIVAKTEWEELKALRGASDQHLPR